MNLRLVSWRCPFAFCLPGKISIFALSTAGMLKLVDKQDLGSCALCVWVRVPLPAQGDCFGKRRSFFLFPWTPGLSPAKKRKTAIQKDGRYA